MKKLLLIISSLLFISALSAEDNKKKSLNFYYSLDAAYYMKYSRETGNNVIISLSNWAKTCIASTDIFVRYMGPKFAIVYIGKTEDDVIDGIKSLKQDLEDTQVEYVNPTTLEKSLVRPIVNFAIGRYYKGTGIESVTKKLEEYLDQASKDEHNINFI